MSGQVRTEKKSSGHLPPESGRKTRQTFTKYPVTIFGERGAAAEKRQVFCASSCLSITSDSGKSGSCSLMLINEGLRSWSAVLFSRFLGLFPKKPKQKRCGSTALQTRETINSTLSDT